MTDVVAKNSKETVDQQTFVDGTMRTVAGLDSAVIGLARNGPSTPVRNRGRTPRPHRQLRLTCLAEC